MEEAGLLWSRLSLAAGASTSDQAVHRAALRHVGGVDGNAGGHLGVSHAEGDVRLPVGLVGVVVQERLEDLVGEDAALVVAGIQLHAEGLGLQDGGGDGLVDDRGDGSLRDGGLRGDAAYVQGVVAAAVGHGGLEVPPLLQELHGVVIVGAVGGRLGRSSLEGVGGLQLVAGVHLQEALLVHDLKGVPGDFAALLEGRQRGQAGRGWLHGLFQSPLGDLFQHQLASGELLGGGLVVVATAHGVVGEIPGIIRYYVLVFDFRRDRVER